MLQARLVWKSHSIKSSIEVSVFCEIYVSCSVLYAKLLASSSELSDFACHLAISERSVTVGIDPFSRLKMPLVRHESREFYGGSSGSLAPTRGSPRTID